jgi:hypothetical protein
MQCSDQRVQASGRPCRLLLKLRFRSWGIVLVLVLETHQGCKVGPKEQKVAAVSSSLLCPHGETSRTSITTRRNLNDGISELLNRPRSRFRLRKTNGPIKSQKATKISKRVKFEFLTFVFLALFCSNISVPVEIPPSENAHQHFSMESGALNLNLSSPDGK